MDIKVEFKGSRVRIVPEVATVPRGTVVNWRCTGVTTGQHEWAFKFNVGSPFGGAHTFTGLSPHRGSSAAAYAVQYQVVVSAGPALDPGDYKYDVELQENGKQIYDIDPRIVVL